MAETPAWAKGHDLAYLKELSALFKAEMAPYCFGAFGLPKERDVATALDEDRLLANSFKKNGPLTGVVIYSVLIQGSVHKDFSGRAFHTAAGDLFIKALAGTRHPTTMFLITRIVKEQNPEVVWAEVHVENQDAVNTLRDLNFRRVATKVAASSDLKGLFVLERRRRVPDPPEELSDQCSFARLADDFITDREADAVATEAEEYAVWADHYSSYNKRHSWSAISLHGYDPSDPGFIIKAAEMSQGWQKAHPMRLGAVCSETTAAANFPVTMKVVRRLPGKKQRVRLMRLTGGGGELTRHADITDDEAGTTPGHVARLHIPILTDKRCLFRSWDFMGREHKVHFAQCGLYYLDVRMPHAVVNPADVARIHLVVDTYSTPELREMIVGAVA